MVVCVLMLTGMSYIGGAHSFCRWVPVWKIASGETQEGEWLTWVPA